MRLLVKSKTTFTQYEITDVTNIAYNGTTYTITHGGQTSTYDVDSYIITIL